MNLTSFEMLDHQIKYCGGEPTVLEALWDGDTRGWVLVFSLCFIKKTTFAIKQEVKQLGVLSCGGDFRLFSGDMPPWPEAIIAKEWGRKAAEKYGLFFYFPSDKEPDDACPGWQQRHLAIACADCGKLIIPTDSPHLPKDICNYCHIKRKQKDEIRNEAPCNEGVPVYLWKEGEFENIGYCSSFDDLTIAPFIDDLVQNSMTEKAINEITLEGQDVVDLKTRIEQALDEKLANYKMPVVDERIKRSVYFSTVEYKGRQYDLMTRGNDEHFQIAQLIPALQTAERAISDDFSYKIYIRKGITYRDDSILRFVHHDCNGSTTITAINKRYAGILTEDEILNTIRKLVEIHCLIMKEDFISITKLATRILYNPWEKL